MQYLPDQFPPPASTGSCSCFLGLVRSWGDTVHCSRPRPGGHYGIGEATDFYLFCWFVVVFFKLIYLRPLLWHCVLSERKEIFTPGFGGNVTCKTTALCTYEGTDQESCWVSLSSATSFVVSCAGSFLRPGPGVFSLLHLCVYLYLPIPLWFISRFSHIWSGGHQSLSKPFKTNRLL